MNSAENNQDELTSADEVAEPPSSPLRRSPGGMLMAQRETLELSLQQVADQLHLTMHFVRAIESDSYDKLPGDVFVRGYIRTYARLLRLDADQVLMIYDEFNSHKIARKEEAIKRRDRRRKDKNRPWVIVSGVAFVAVAVALWYLNPAQPSDTVADAASESEVALATAAELAALELPATAQVSNAGTTAATTASNILQTRDVAEANNSAMPGSAIAATAVSGSVVSDSGLADSTIADSTDASSGLADAANAGVTAVNSAASDGGAASSSETGAAAGNVTDGVVPPVTEYAQAGAASGQTQSASPAPASTEPITPAMQPAASGRTVMEYWAGADELRIGFRADSAVQIEHKGGSEAHDNIHVAGETLVIRGTAPFSVLLGDARNVSLSFNGRQIDISSNIRVDNSARLSIGM